MFSVGIVLGSVSTGAGWNATLSVLIAGLGVLAIGYAVAIFARRFSGAGAVYEYLTHGAHPAVGIFAAGIFFVGSLFLGGGGIYLGLGILGNSFWVEHISSSAPSWWLIALVFLAVTLVLNYIGVRIAIGAMLTMSAISFVPMLFLGIVMVAKGGDGGNTLSVFNPGSTSTTTAFNGVLLAILLFVGFEAAASIGEESRDPKRAIPRAVLGTVAASAAFFVFMAYAISIGLGRKAVESGAWLDPAVLDKLSTRYVGSWLGTIIDLVVILDAFGLALAICVTIGRGYFALGRDGLLPKVFAKTSRHDTPWVGNLMVIVGGVGLILLTQVASYGSQFVVPGTERVTGADLPERPVRDVHHGGDGRVVHGGARVRAARRRGGQARVRGGRRRCLVEADRAARRDRDADPRLQGRALALAPRLEQLQLGRALLVDRDPRARGHLARHLHGDPSRPGAPGRPACGRGPRRPADRRPAPLLRS